MKKLIIAVLCAALVLPPLSLKTSALPLSAASAVLIEAETGTVLYEANAYEQRAMASTSITTSPTQSSANVFISS